MSDLMTFPDSVEEFMERYKIVDTDGIYMSKGAELVPIFRMRQWFEHLPSAQRTGRWKVLDLPKGKMKYCSECGFGQYIADERQYRYCPNCGADMRGEQNEL